MTAANEKPLVVAMSLPGAGHTIPVMRAAAHLASRGFDVWFVTAADFESSALSSGIARFFPSPSPFALHPDLMAGYMDLPEGPARLDFVFRNVFLRDTKQYAAALRGALETARAETPGRRVVVLQDMSAGGALPFIHGAPPPKGYEDDGFPPVVSLNVSVIFCTSADAPPIGFPVDPVGREGEEVLRLHGEFNAGTAETRAMLNVILGEMGCTRRVEALADAWLEGPDLTLQLCSPGLEYRRRDLSPKIRFVGGLPLPEGKGGPLPDWLREHVEAQRESQANGQAKRRKLVFVTQGTVDIDHSELLIPALQGLGAREDLFVVGVLGRKGARLPESVESSLPSANVKVLDYFSYNDILPHADVFITNGGYGGFMHGVMNGSPMIIAGVSNDKGDVANRMENAGLGINLRTATPTPEQISAAVDQVLADSSYKQRALEIKKENEEMDSFARIEKAVLEVAR
ncbi:hypothetical protein MCOR27_010356 [Pyricularia oryzae]|nr:hypothetical protein MCOR27_010356 [Pyricularia oryzae]KAI6326080.1 hypothetical protein MCOR29_003575 [Pyricularia oryzae]KAI6528685.1 hypothetical protein MCOR05_008344 [Pyricularia oryzae]